MADEIIQPTREVAKFRKEVSIGPQVSTQTTKGNSLPEMSSLTNRPLKRKIAKQVSHNSVEVQQPIPSSTIVRPAPSKNRCVVGPLQVERPKEPKRQETVKRRSSVFERLGEDTESEQLAVSSGSTPMFKVTNNFGRGLANQKQGNSETVFSRLGDRFGGPNVSSSPGFESNDDDEEEEEEEETDLSHNVINEDEIEEADEKLVEDDGYEMTEDDYRCQLQYSNSQNIGSLNGKQRTRCQSPVRYQGILKKTQPHVNNVVRKSKISNTMRADQEERHNMGSNVVKQMKNPIINKKAASFKPPTRVSTDGILGNSSRGVKNHVKQRLGGPESIVLKYNKAVNRKEPTQVKSVGSTTMQMKRRKPIVFDINYNDTDDFSAHEMNGYSRGTNTSSNFPAGSEKRVQFASDVTETKKKRPGSFLKGNDKIGSFTFNTRPDVFKRLGD